MAHERIASGPVPETMPVWLGEHTDPLVAVNARPLAAPAAREHWKYTSLTPALEALEGPAIPPQIETFDQSGITVEANYQPDQRLIDRLTNEHTYCPAAACALLNNVGFTRVSLSASTQRPIELLAGSALHPIVIDIADGVTAEIVDRDVGSPTLWHVLRIGEGAKASLYRARVAPREREWHKIQVSVAANATFDLNQYAVGGPYRRHDLQIDLIGAAAHANIVGAWSANARKKYDLQAHVNHLAPHTRSEQTYHGLVNDRATASFRGRIYIAEHCPQVDAALANKNLNLGSNSRVNTKPELEIYTDDVRCAHGATVGKLDEQALFFLRSRGIGESQARELLAKGFLHSCLSGPLVEEVRDALVAGAQSTKS